MAPSEIPHDIGRRTLGRGFDALSVSLSVLAGTLFAVLIALIVTQSLS